MDQSAAGEEEERRHFVLVHGFGQGAWCWYKVVAALRAAGHRATAVDLAASGVHPARIDEVHSFEDYARPLLDAVAAAPEGERLVLVGHSYGGLCVALAVERLPRKVAAAVFVAASMPCVGKHMGITTEFIRNRASTQGLMDSVTLPINTNQGPGTALLLGPKFLAEEGYNRSPPEVLALATMLVRPGNQFMEDPMMKDDALLTGGNYGSVRKVYVVTRDDTACPEEVQRRMVALSPGTAVEEIAGSDHAVMCSKPGELVDVLVKVAQAV